MAAAGHAKRSRHKGINKPPTCSLSPAPGCKGYFGTRKDHALRPHQGRKIPVPVKTRRPCCRFDRGRGASMGQRASCGSSPHAHCNRSKLRVAPSSSALLPESPLQHLVRVVRLVLHHLPQGFQVLRMVVGGCDIILWRVCCKLHLRCACRRSLSRGEEWKQSSEAMPGHLPFVVKPGEPRPNGVGLLYWCRAPCSPGNKHSRFFLSLQSSWSNTTACETGKYDRGSS